MDGAKCIYYTTENPKGRDHLGDLPMGVRIVLKLILKK
jgi:hypothetical protein